MVSEFTYNYGQGFVKDIRSLVKLIKKENTIDFDPQFLANEVKKIIKYNKLCTHKKWVWTTIRIHKSEKNQEDIDAKLCLRCKRVFPFCREWSEFYSKGDMS